MITGMRLPIATAIIGVAAGTVGEVAPLYLPDTPQWVWGLVFWFGIATIAGALVWGAWPYRSSFALKSFMGHFFDFLPTIKLTRRISRMPLLELRDRATEMGWDFYGVGSTHLLDFIHGLRQAAQDGDVTFWGRPDRNEFDALTKNEVLQKIAGDHFIDFKIDVVGLASHLDGGPVPKENFDTRTSGLALGDRSKCYRDLHVDRHLALRWLRKDAEQFKGMNQPRL